MSSGIYSFKNRVNGKRYVGQSQNLETRFNSHKNNHSNSNLKDYNTKFYRALRKHGFDCFEYSILEECELADANEREIFWVSYYDSYNNGYNSNKGGESVTERAELHPCAKLTNSQVTEIKDLLLNSEQTQYQIAERFFVSQSIISEINTGDKWASVGLNVFPIRDPKKRKRVGESNPHTVLNDEIVVEIRERYAQETGKQIFEDYMGLCSYTTFERALTGRTYSHLPIYKKKQKEWIKK